MRLNIKLPSKEVVVNGKTISIPKLGIKHFELIREPRGYDENMKILMGSIAKNLTKAEQDIVGLHLLAFNGIIKDKVEYNDKTYTIDDVVITQKLKQEYNGFIYRFRSADHEALVAPVDILLKKCLMSVKYDGTEIPKENFDKIDFLEFPAFVNEWADQITCTVQITIDGTTVKGINDVMEIFNGRKQ